MPIVNLLWDDLVEKKINKIQAKLGQELTEHDKIEQNQALILMCLKDLNQKIDRIEGVVAEAAEKVGIKL